MKLWVEMGSIMQKRFSQLFNFFIDFALRCVMFTFYQPEHYKLHTT
jgi:hypothetical protein